MGIALRRLFFFSLLVAYMAFIWIQSSYFDPETTGARLSDVISLKWVLLLGISFEMAHLFQFGILYLLVIMVFLSFGKLTWWMEVIALCMAFFYGLLDEIHQMYVPFRSASLTDLIKNCIGILGAWWFVRKYYIDNQDSRIGRFFHRLAQTSQR
jgi:polysaccharide biosynthesis protein VpsQ